MRGVRVIVGLAMLMLASAAGASDPPDPRVYARAEDRARARSFDRPCTPADVGRGCFRENGRLVRAFPCADRAADGSVRYRREAQCYRMERARRHRGVWIDEFEGQRFVPAGTTPLPWPDPTPGTPDAREQYERVRRDRIWIDAGRFGIERRFRRMGTRRLVEFIGRRTRYPGRHGHMGMSGHLMVVDRVISVRDCAGEGVCGQR